MHELIKTILFIFCDSSEEENVRYEGNVAIIKEPTTGKDILLFQHANGRNYTMVFDLVAPRVFTLKEETLEKDLAESVAVFLKDMRIYGVPVAAFINVSTFGYIALDVNDSTCIVHTNYPGEVTCVIKQLNQSEYAVELKHANGTEDVKQPFNKADLFNYLLAILPGNA